MDGNLVNVRKTMQQRFYAGLLATLGILALGWWLGNVSGLTMPGGRLVAVGRLFGLLAAFCILLEVFLMSRVPLIEKYFDLEEMVDLHRLNGYGILLSIVGHVVFITLGYAEPGHTGLWAQFLHLNISYDDVLKATIGTVIFFVATALSVQVARKRLRYEVWHAVHLTMYLAILLAFFHQLKIGGDFVNQRWFTAYWYGIYILVFGLLAYYRAIRSVISYLRHGFRIARVEREADNIYSIYVTGRDLEHFEFLAGQYAGWRIFSKNLWWQSHPFSFSSPPGRGIIRFSVKSTSGDFSKQIESLKPGTHIFIDGPRGSFTADRAHADNVVMIAGGIGVAPYIATIESLLAEGKKVSLLYAARTEQDLAFRRELGGLQRNGLQIHTFLGSQGKRIDGNVLERFAKPSTAMYICGPDAMTRSFVKDLRRRGIAKHLIISERFAF